jgi:hypothetical protein
MIHFPEVEVTEIELLQEFPELVQSNVIFEKEIYAHFGLLYMGFALLEHSLINVVTIKLNVDTLKKHTKPSRVVWTAEYDNSFEHAIAQTFGNLAKVVVTVPEFRDLTDGLNKVKRIRDYFSHHFFRREAAHMSEKQSALALLLDIRRARILVDMVESEMKSRNVRYLKRLGLPELSDTFIEEESERLQEKELDQLHKGMLPRGFSRWLERGKEW